MPKIVDLVVNGMQIDLILSSPKQLIRFQNKQAYRKRIESDQTLYLSSKKRPKRILEWILSMPIDELPMTKEELNIHMQMEWKPSNCLSNHTSHCYGNGRKRIQQMQTVNVRDVVDGIGCNFTRLNPSKGIIQKNGRE
jgi:hypothetical protein